MPPMPPEVSVPTAEGLLDMINANITSEFLWKLGIFTSALILFPALLFGIAQIGMAFLNIAWTLALSFSKLNVWALFTGKATINSADSILIDFNSPMGKVMLTLILLVL